MLARGQARDERWYFAELLRIKGELLRKESSQQSLSVAEQCFGEALDVARLQGALFWSSGRAEPFAPEDAAGSQG